MGSQSPIVKLKNPGDGTVNINTADIPTLERLPGIGPAMAARIINERAAVGRFRKPSDLFEVRGIGPKKFAKMEPFVVVQ
jgi:competence protein ComEA